MKTQWTQEQVVVEILGAEAHMSTKQVRLCMAGWGTLMEKLLPVLPVLPAHLHHYQKQYQLHAKQTWLLNNWRSRASGRLGLAYRPYGLNLNSDMMALVQVSWLVLPLKKRTHMGNLPMRITDMLIDRYAHSCMQVSTDKPNLVCPLWEKEQQKKSAIIDFTHAQQQQSRSDSGVPAPFSVAPPGPGH